MQTNSKDQWKRFFRIRKQITAMILLAALLLIVFAPSATFAGTIKAPEGMVFCPLSRRFQPINPPAEKKESEPFKDMCASFETKAHLFDEIILKNPFRFSSFDENKLDDLAFNFLAHGQSAIRDLPNLPNFPTENLVKKLGRVATANNDYEHKFLWIKPLRFASLTVLARPPTTEITAFYTSNLIHRSDELTRRLAPRAPPVRS